MKNLFPSSSFSLLSSVKRWKPADLWKCFLPPRAPPPFDIYKSIKIIWYFFHRKYFFRHGSVSKGGDLWRSKKIIRDDTAGSRMKNNAIILLRERKKFLYWQVNASGAERPRHSVYVCKQHLSEIIFFVHIHSLHCLVDIMRFVSDCANIRYRPAKHQIINLMIQAHFAINLILCSENNFRGYHD